MFGKFITKNRREYKNESGRAVACVCFLICALVSIHAGAAAQFSGDQNGLIIESLPDNTVSVRVSGPGNFSYETNNNYIQSTNSRALADGQYSYEVTGYIINSVELDAIHSLNDRNRFETFSAQNNGRSDLSALQDVEQSTSGYFKSVNQSATKVIEFGFFRIENGKVVSKTAEKERK